MRLLPGEERHGSAGELVVMLEDAAVSGVRVDDQLGTGMRGHCSCARRRRTSSLRDRCGPSETHLLRDRDDFEFYEHVGLEEVVHSDQ